MLTKNVVLLAIIAAGSLFGAGRVDPSTLDGKVLFGYQGWFDCPMESVPRSNWSHWSRGVPTAESTAIDMYPDLSEFAPSDLCAVPGMTIGSKPAYLFSARNPRIVQRHFEWMRDYELDGVLVQRFIGSTPRLRSSGDEVLKNIMAAAEKTGRVFAIEYDISGGKDETFFRMLQEDWTYLVDVMKVTSHPNYLKHNGKPVLSVWGMGLGDGKHPPADPEAAKQVIRWFKAEAASQYRVTYMGGTPARWHTLDRDSYHDAAWRDVYRMMDVVQPWNVGRYGTVDQVDKWKTGVLSPDLEELNKNGQIYMPVIFPGFSWHNLNRDKDKNQIPRLGGEFLWRQAYNARAAGATVLKIAMFDEVNESTAMFKVASKRSDAPEQGYWLTLDADGKELPSDWYLRLAGEITRAFHSRAPLPAQAPRNPRPAAK